jgi:O-antigen/teichoic acid export membrane protein
VATQQQLIDALSTEHLQPDLRGRSVRGGLLTLTSQGSQFLIQSMSTVVLARLLTPAEFGLVAMVSAITGLGQAFADLGLSEATIQRKDITHEQVSALFWINGAIGLGLTFITACLAPILSRFYREPRLIGITLVMSLTFLFGGLRVQADALLKRKMRFSSLAVRDITSSAIGVGLAIVLAKQGLGYWALVALPLTLNLMQMALSWLMVDWKPGMPSRHANVGSMISFGGKVAASYLLLNVMRSADSILIGRYLGARPLGIYSRAFNLMMTPINQLNLPITSVAVPAFSRIQDDPERFARSYLRTVNLLMWMSAPIVGFLFVAAEPVTVLILGNKWREAAPVFQILAISALAQLLHASTLWLFVSRGQSGRLLRVSLIVSPIFIASYLIGLPFGIRGVALSASLVQLTALPWILKYTFRGTHLTLGRLGQAVLYPTSLCLAGVVVAELALHLVAPQHMVSQFLVATVSFGATYLLSALIPSVREEALSLWELVSELRLRRQTQDLRG